MDQSLLLCCGAKNWRYDRLIVFRNNIEACKVGYKTLAMYISQKLIIVLHCWFCIPVNKTSSPSKSVAQTAEHIAAWSGGLSSNARAAAAVDAVFTRVADGNFRLMKSRHWPRAYNSSGLSCVWFISAEETHLFVAQDFSDIIMLHAFPDQ